MSRRWLLLIFVCLIAGAGSRLIPPRIQAASFSVINLSDSGVGSLRQAILDANSNGPGADDITFAIPSGSTITLTTGELFINSDLNIDGPGASITGVTIVQTTPGARVFQINTGRSVAMADLTISGGNSPVSGAGMLNSGSLILNNVAVQNNTLACNLGCDGGGIFNLGLLIANNVSITGNHITGSLCNVCLGAGIANQGTARLFRATVSGNSIISDPCATSCLGAGVFNNGNFNIEATTISGNSITATNTGLGGGVASNGNAFNLDNTTIAGNSSLQAGGLYIFGGLASLNNVTVSTNTATSPVGFAGGLDIDVNATVNFRNTILAGNTATNQSDCSVTVGATFTSLGYNLMQVPCFISGGILTGNKTGVSANLGPLANNGGPTQTMALLAGSPAIDAGNPAGCVDHINVAFAFDQRDFPFQRTQDGDNNGTSICDMGAFEVQALATATPTATASPTVTATRTITATATLTATATAIATASPTPIIISTPRPNVSGAFLNGATGTEQNLARAGLLPGASGVVPPAAQQPPRIDPATVGSTPAQLRPPNTGDAGLAD